MNASDEKTFLHFTRWALILIAVILTIEVVVLGVFTYEISRVAHLIAATQRTDEELIATVKSIGILPITERRLEEQRQETRAEFERLWKKLDAMHPDE